MRTGYETLVSFLVSQLLLTLSLPFSAEFPSLAHLWSEPWPSEKRRGTLSLGSFSLRHCPPFRFSSRLSRSPRVRAATSTTKTSTLCLLLEKPTPPLHRSAKTEFCGAFPVANAPLRRRRVGPCTSILGGSWVFKGASQRSVDWEARGGRRRS